MLKQSLYTRRLQLGGVGFWVRLSGPGHSATACFRISHASGKLPSNDALTSKGSSARSRLYGYEHWHPDARLFKRSELAQTSWMSLRDPKPTMQLPVLENRKANSNNSSV